MQRAPLIEVSVGELYDKYSILCIKLDRIQDTEKLAHISYELSKLGPIMDQYPDQDGLYMILRACNEELWSIEDAIREKESAGEFDATFIGLARSVYITNDRRGDIKRRINKVFGSQMVEVKEYSAY